MMRRVVVAVMVALSATPLYTNAVHATEIPDTPAKPKQVLVGKIRIPRLKVSTTIYKGITDRQFDIGVGYWPGTALPGQKGNMVIGGHRTAAKRPFYNIEKMKVGDIITVSRPGKTYTYRVTKTFIVRPRDVWIVKPTKTTSITLFTCHPRGSTSKRYVVRATLIR